MSVMITSEQSARLRNVIVEAAIAGLEAVIAFGVESQEIMAIEEMGELLTMLARGHRGRCSDKEIVDEAADVIITVLQIGLIFGSDEDYGPNALIDSIAFKASRLRDRVRRSRT
jgi:NTP pyrophosphatase (non-canonical NTP hydrolase)